MRSREIVQRTLDYDRPDRVARSFGDSDFVHCRYSVETNATDWRQVAPSRWERTDEWGNTWARIDTTSMGEVARGVLDDLSAVSSYELPDYSNPADYDVVKARRRDVPDKWLCGSLPGFTFNIARKMRRLEQYLVDLLDEPDLIRQLHDRIDLVLADMISNYAAAGVDGVMFPEDWGTQSQTLISPALWRQEFFPRFKNLCGIAHECGIKVFMHSCGNTGAIVPGLIEAGIDLLQFDQPDLHGLDVLAGHQRAGKITFWCPVDIQKTLQLRDEQAIRSKAREMLDKLWAGRRGFVAGYYGDNDSIGLDPKWQKLACDEFVERGKRAHYDA